MGLYMGGLYSGGLYSEVSGMSFTIGANRVLENITSRIGWKVGHLFQHDAFMHFRQFRQNWIRAEIIVGFDLIDLRYGAASGDFPRRWKYLFSNTVIQNVSQWWRQHRDTLVLIKGACLSRHSCTRELSRSTWISGSSVEYITLRGRSLQ